MKNSEKLIVALDTDIHRAENIVEAVPATWFKVGSVLYTQAGPEAVRMVKDHKNTKVFLDLKYHDIPNTVADAVKAAADLGVDMLTVHASGGPRMIDAAKKAAPKVGIIAITVLTSLLQVDLDLIGQKDPLMAQVRRLAKVALNAGADGVVSSPKEVLRLRQDNPDAWLIVPGIRPADGDNGDQARVATPSSALRDGADFLVVGRPIIAAPDWKAAASVILKEMAEFTFE